MSDVEACKKGFPLDFMPVVFRGPGSQKPQQVSRLASLDFA